MMDYRFSIPRLPALKEAEWRESDEKAADSTEHEIGPQAAVIAPDSRRDRMQLTANHMFVPAIVSRAEADDASGRRLEKLFIPGLIWLSLAATLASCALLNALLSS